MTIKHLVLSGGGPSMIQTIGAIQHLHENKFIDFKNIETIYGTSAGIVIGIILCLNYDFETTYDYLIKRPWNELFSINVQHIFEAYTKKGIFDIKTIEKCFKPLFDAKDISLDITLEDFYKYSNIELHFITFDINNFQLEDISYLNNPSLSLMTAVQMTCGLPVLVSPVCLNDKCYVDGGVVCNYPIQFCINSGKKEDEILGFKNVYDKCDNVNINNDSSILDFILSFLFKTINSLSKNIEQPSITHEVLCNASLLTLSYINSAISSMDVRKELYQNGINYGKQFLTKQCVKIDQESPLTV
jgi:predicted acylesterase/phospholipase RssA